MVSPAADSGDMGCVFAAQAPDTGSTRLSRKLLTKKEQEPTCASALEPVPRLQHGPVALEAFSELFQGELSAPIPGNGSEPTRPTHRFDPPVPALEELLDQLRRLWKILSSAPSSLCLLAYAETWLVQTAAGRPRISAPRTHSWPKPWDPKSSVKAAQAFPRLACGIFAACADAEGASRAHRVRIACASRARRWCKGTCMPASPSPGARQTPAANPSAETPPRPSPACLQAAASCQRPQKQSAEALPAHSTSVHFEVETKEHPELKVGSELLAGSVEPQLG